MGVYWWEQRAEGLRLLRYVGVSEAGRGIVGSHWHRDPGKSENSDSPQKFCMKRENFHLPHTHQPPGLAPCGPAVEAGNRTKALLSLTQMGPFVLQKQALVSLFQETTSPSSLATSTLTGVLPCRLPGPLIQCPSVTREVGRPPRQAGSSGRVGVSLSSRASLWSCRCSANECP